MKQILIKFLLPLILLFACLGFAACGDSDNVELPAQLDSPKNVKIEKGILTWDEVEYADGYYVHIDDEKNQTAECRYDLTDLSADKDYIIKVVAYSNAEGVQDSKYIGMKYTADNILTDKGFEFKKASNTNDYRVTKFAVDENGVCVIPATYGGRKVVSLTPSKDDSSILKIKSLYLPSTINSTTLELPMAGSFGLPSPFRYFKNLETVEIEEADGSNYISEGGCIINKLTKTLVLGGIKAEIPSSVKAIGIYAFAWRNITELTLPDTITKIEGGAFLECELLTSISLPANLTQIEIETFYNCKSLTEILLPSGITKIDKFAFSNCTSLTSCNIPVGLTTLESEAFLYSTSLKSIVLPKSVTRVGQYAFHECPLEEVYYFGSEAEWKEMNIGATGNDAFLAAARYYYSETPPETSGNFWHYVDGVPTKWAV